MLCDAKQLIYLLLIIKLQSINKLLIISHFRLSVCMTGFRYFVRNSLDNKKKQLYVK